MKISMTYKDYLLELEKEHKRRIKVDNKLKKVLSDIRKNCKHSKSYFQEDPSGGQDSALICLECRKKL